MYAYVLNNTDFGLWWTTNQTRKKMIGLFDWILSACVEMEVMEFPWIEVFQLMSRPKFALCTHTFI
jgi:hypothetical protein